MPQKEKTATAVAIQKEKLIKLKPITELEEETIDLNTEITPAD